MRIWFRAFLLVGFRGRGYGREEGPLPANGHPTLRAN